MGIIDFSIYAVSETVSYQRSKTGATQLTVNVSASHEDLKLQSVDIALSQKAKRSDDEKALSTLTKLAADAKLYPKKAAKDKLATAIKQLQIIKLLGGLKGAKTLVDLAKQISSAAKDYAEAEQTLADKGSQASSPDGSVAPAPAARATTVEAPPEQDPFFTDAEQALGEIKKALHKILPGEEASPDRKAREAARRLRHDFNQAVDETLNAETSFNSVEPQAASYEDASGLTAIDKASDLPAPSGAFAIAPVNLTI